MGSEDLLHKRKARAGSELRRQQHERALNKRYLIVYEGTKTEPHYFRDLLDDLGIRPKTVNRPGVTGMDMVRGNAANSTSQHKI